VDDKPGEQAVAFGYFGLARFAALQQTAFFLQRWPCCAMDSTIYTTATQQACVCCVYDGIHGEGGNVGLDYAHYWV
jgi:hypothetical protein